MARSGFFPLQQHWQANCSWKELPGGWAESLSLQLRDQAAGQVYNVFDEPVLSELEWREGIAVAALLVWRRMLDVINHQCRHLRFL
jgi:hypothetical protein